MWKSFFMPCNQGYIPGYKEVKTRSLAATIDFAICVYRRIVQVCNETA